MGQSPPALEIDASTGSQVRLSWLDVPGTLVLETTDSLSLWQPFPSPPTLLDGRFSVAADITDTPRFYRLRLTEPGGLPPDPATVAPTVPLGVTTQLGEATRFLYTGANPIQTGVAPGVLEARRAAVVRGRVKSRDDTPLSGVTISIHNHPELGQTLSRADGMFDLAVNGGGVLTLNYQMTGFLPAQRQVDAPWQDFVHAPEILLIPVDTQVTPIATNAAEMQVARGSVMNDSDGNRQATLLVPAGTTATMTLADGTTVPLSSLNVRATEYTVGPNGPQAMPAALPPASGYTYAVELSADEAIAAGARSVVFSQPLFNYVENFLAFPVGMIVPNGYYDREQAAWIPSENGRVIKITGENAGLAVVDTVGAGGLPPVVLSVEELETLAQLYAPGQELWRVPIAHFTPWDHNWPHGSPADAVRPPIPTAAQEADDAPDDPCIETGSSTIEVESQILGEAIAVPGTPFSLHYQSNRMPGRAAAFALDIALSGAQVPASLQRIDLEISVAGQKREQSFSPAPNLRHSFIWDRKDAFGREVQGVAAALVRVGFVYKSIFQRPAELARSFGRLSGIPLTVDRGGGEVVVWSEGRALLGILGVQVGGWSLSVHHAYDTGGSVIHLGDGTRRSAAAIGPVISTTAGNGSAGPLDGDGGPALQAALGELLDVTAGADGSLYFTSANRVRRVGPDGIISALAGSDTPGFGGDGGSGTQALLNRPGGLTVTADGSVYIADTFNHRIRRVTPDGVITTVAGTGTPGFRGDQGPAALADLNHPFDVAAAPDGSLYIADTLNQRIRHVGPDGTITTLAGTGVIFSDGDGGRAALASFGNPSSVAIGPDGSVYILDINGGRIRRISTNGIIRTVAGGGRNFGDSIPATQAGLSLDTSSPPAGLAVGSDGSIFLSEGGSSRIRRVGPDGIIRTFAGVNASGSPPGFNGDGRAAVQTTLSYARGIAIGPENDIYIADSGNRRIRRVTAPVPGFTGVALTVPSTDGGEIYGFRADGRHLVTLNAMTGGVIYSFAYDALGRLTAVTDAFQHVTSIQRDGSGHPTAIVGPFGQTTALAVNPDGYLGRITSPAGENITLEYTAGGLLTSLINPRGHISRYTFDPSGRLTSATDATGAVKTISRAGSPKDSTVTMTTSLGAVTTYRSERLVNGDTRRTTIDPAGKQIRIVKSPNGSQTATYPDGTTVSAVLGPDPRWGMLAPLASSVLVTTPGGRTFTKTVARTVLLSDPADLVSFTTMTEITRINGRAFTRAYNAATRTFTSTSPSGRKGTLVVDPMGNPVESQFGGLAARTLTYDLHGRLASSTHGTDAASRTTTYDYGASGFLQSTTDADGRVLTFTRNANGRTTGLTFPGGAMSLFAYDANGNFTRLTPPERPDHVFEYTENNQPSAYASPVTDAVDNRTEYTYTTDRQPLQIDRPDGTSVNAEYDAAGRIHRVDTAVGDTQYFYDSAGRLATLVRDGGAELAYSYDGGLATGMTWSGPIAGSVTLAYDNFFRVTSHSVNGDTPILITYDLDGLPTKSGDLTLSRSALNGFVTGTTLGTVTTATTHDDFGAPASHAASRSSGVVYSVMYTRDALGRIASKSETIDGISQAFAYTYDLTGRLAEVRQDSVLTAGYTYDGNGNRLSRTNASGATTATYDAQDRLLQFGSTTFVHNANGERRSKTASGQTTGYHYDTFGNLAGVSLPDGTLIDYVLDGEQRRVGRKINGTLAQGFLYQDGLKPIAELDGTHAVVSRFVYSTGENVPAYLIKAGVTYRIITDHLGSPRLVIDATTGTLAQRLDYDEFGKITLDTNPGFQPFGFAGGLADQSSGLVHFGAREYDPDTGRWITKDPIGFVGGDANLYGYVLGDPVNRTDPSGLLFGDLFDALVKPLPYGMWGLPCVPGEDDTQGEAAVRDALGNLIDDQVDNGVQLIVGGGGKFPGPSGIVGGGKFIGPVGTAVDAATVAAEGFIIVHEAPREQRDLIDTILTGSTVEQDYATRRYFAPNGPRPCPSGKGPCSR